VNHRYEIRAKINIFTTSLIKFKVWKARFLSVSGSVTDM
jgi:hypothetical protein